MIENYQKEWRFAIWENHMTFRLHRSWMKFCCSFLSVCLQLPACCKDRVESSQQSLCGASLTSQGWRDRDRWTVECCVRAASCTGAVTTWPYFEYQGYYCTVTFYFIIRPLPVLPKQDEKSRFLVGKADICSKLKWLFQQRKFPSFILHLTAVEELPPSLRLELISPQCDDMLTGRNQEKNLM